jgi:tetratricopeptide (TPR) repeat protein
MDLSWLKWPLVILVVVGVFWLLSSGGISFMYSRFTQGTPGQDAEADTRNEARLTTLGSFLMKTLRYEKAEEVITTAIERYPQGKNVLLNQYRLCELLEKRNANQEAVELLEYLMSINAHELDHRVPINDTLRLRADKLIEMHEIREGR